MIDSPAATIARLDASLARRGETIVLRRLRSGTTTWDEITVRGRFTGYTTNDLVGSVKQVYREFILSPTAINAAVLAGTWPPASGGGADPKAQDELKDASGVSRRIEAILPRRLNNVIVRYEGRILG